MHQTRTQMGTLIAPPAVALALAVILLAALGVESPVLAQGGRDDGASVFSLDRIELSLYGGWFGGVTYLDLPPIAPDANDLGATDILDFSGDPLGRPKYPGQIDAARKEVDPGWQVGFGAAFFLSKAFAIELVGAYGKSQVSVSGQYLNQEELPDEDPRPGRFEWDRSDIDWIKGGANMLYVFSPERKLRPFVQLGLGGILNRLPKTDDVGALYFSYGGGLRYVISEAVDLKLQFESALFTWSQEEVDRNETVQYPMASVGLIWKYDVPEETLEPPAAEAPEGGQGS